MNIKDQENIVRLDRRDLFGAVRSAIKYAMLDQGSREDDSELFGDADARANECLSELYASEALIAGSADGGPAFGEIFQDGNLVSKSGGMSLRDYFAAKAMQGLCADPTTAGTRLEDIAEDCYLIADAMLAAREVLK